MTVGGRLKFYWITKIIFFILAVTLLAGGAAFLFTKLFIPPTYRAQVKFCADSEESGNADITYYKSSAPVYVELLNVSEFYKMVADELLDTTQKAYDTAKIQRMVTFSGVVADTSVFYARVTAGSPQEAYDVAVAVANCAPRRIKSLRSGDTLMVASMPSMPTSPASPNIRNNTVYGLLAGLVLSVLLVIAVGLWNKKARAGGKSFGKT